MPRPYRSVVDNVRPGFTLVELLVVIAVIGVLVALLLPAVQAARESTRRSACHANLRQLCVAVQLHHDTHGFYPSGGWGFVWTGDPDRGAGAEQPGGWLYHLLPYLEEGATHALGRGLSVAEKLVTASEAPRVGLAVANCPSRRAVGLTPYTSTRAIVNAEPTDATFKADYAACAGDTVTNQQGPPSIEAADGFDWGLALEATGMIYTRSETRAAEITDGTSHTYAIGEKRCQLNAYDWGDDQHALVGHGTDVARFTATETINFQGDVVALPYGADSEESHSRSFGSVHPAGAAFAYADGSVRVVAYDVDPELHRRAGHRADGIANDERAPSRP